MIWFCIALVVLLVAARLVGWQVLAWIVSRDWAFERIRRRAYRTPYTHIMSADGTDRYMGRWWLFNPYPSERDGEMEQRNWFWQWMPSVRLHHICRPDQDRHCHDHPWDARTLIGRGWYVERRIVRWWKHADVYAEVVTWPPRQRGQTATLKHGEYHRITEVAPGGVWTIFITWRKQGSWGFLVNGVKVPWREYLGIEQRVRS